MACCLPLQLVYPNFLLTSSNMRGIVLPKLGLPNSGGNSMPLRIAPAGSNLRVVRIDSDEKTKRHLESLGITLDAEVEILSHCGDSTICKVKESRLAFDTAVSSSIFVA
jgi:Fe2+ transport system protein FeoA